MSPFNNKMRFIILMLLISGIFYCKVSSAYNGIAITTTYVLDKSQYPAMLKRYKPDNIYALYSGPMVSLSKDFKAGIPLEDTIINYKKFIQSFPKDKLPLRTRKFLSSVGSESAFDGKAGRHSPFANLLLQVLRAKGNGSNGIVTLSDINAVLQTASLNETATLKISPHMADFGTVDAFSEFIFIPIALSGNK